MLPEELTLIQPNRMKIKSR